MQVAVVRLRLGERVFNRSDFRNPRLGFDRALCPQSHRGRTRVSRRDVRIGENVPSPGTRTGENQSSYSAQNSRSKARKFVPTKCRPLCFYDSKINYPDCYMLQVLRSRLRQARFSMGRPASHTSILPTRRRTGRLSRPDSPAARSATAPITRYRTSPDMRRALFLRRHLLDSQEGIAVKLTLDATALFVQIIRHLRD